jgi:hypothetical protein
MQKLVTICLHCHDARHGAVEEHLTDLLVEGWSIASVTPLGCPMGASAAVWVAVVLESGFPLGQSAAQNAQISVPVVEFPQSAAGRPVEPSDIPVRPDTPLEVGSTVLSFSQGRWWRAVVIGLEAEDQVRLHFPGWDAKWDVTVSRDELQVDLHGFSE